MFETKFSAIIRSKVHSPFPSPQKFLNPTETTEELLACRTRVSDVTKLIEKEWNTTETPGNDEQEETEEGKNCENDPGKDTVHVGDVRHDVILTVWTVHLNRHHVIR